MVAVVEDETEIGGARYIEFRVHRSESEPGRVLGSWRFEHGASGLVDQSRPEAPVLAEFRHCLDCADQHGIPIVWVNDPEELFPAWARR